MLVTLWIQNSLQTRQFHYHQNNNNHYSVEKKDKNVLRIRWNGFLNLVLPELACIRGIADIRASNSYYSIYTYILTVLQLLKDNSQKHFLIRRSSKIIGFSLDYK